MNEGEPPFVEAIFKDVEAQLEEELTLKVSFRGYATIDDFFKAMPDDEILSICMEECCELAQAVSKCRRKKKKRKRRLRKEMADVAICLKLLMNMYDISGDKLQSEVENKLKRNEKRLEKRIEKQEAQKEYDYDNY